MRSFSRSWVAYVLLFLIAVAFTIWGVNGAFNGTGSNDLATVNGREVTPEQLSRELDSVVRNARNEGRDVTQQDAIDANVHVQLLESMINGLALRTYADRLGLSVSDAEVAARIRELPMVQSQVTGAFDEGAYQTFLQQIRYTRPEFELEVREGLTNQMLMEAMLAGLRAPSSFGALILAYNNETRVITVAEAPASAAGAVPPPTAEQIQAFYEDNQERLRVPEFRALTLVIASRDDFAARITVPDSALREEYEAQRAAHTEPERRTYIRFTATSEAQANDVAARLNRGEAPAAVASATGLQVGGGENQTSNEVTDSGVAAAVFQMPVNGPARVVRGQLSPFVVVRVTGVTPAVTPTFESLRDTIRAAAVADQAAQALDAAVTAFDDARGAGAPIADAARQAGLRIVSIPAVSAEGADPNGQPVAAFNDQAAVLAAAFDTPEGEASDFLSYGDADAVVSVDQVTPSSVRPLDDVRPQLVAAWTARERTRLLRELGETIAAAVREGQSFAQATRNFRTIVRSSPVTRDEAGQIPANGFGAQIFAASEGDTLSGVRLDNGAVYVAIVEHINRVDPNANPQALEAARAQVQEGVAQSFAEAIQLDVVARANVRRNETLLNQRFRGSGANEDDAAQ
jgi:peptidyl-prolyl cis-trans isomerase D